MSSTKPKNKQEPKKTAPAVKDDGVKPPPAPKKPKKRYNQVFFRAWCKACGICSAFCPKGVIGRGEDGTPVVDKPDECIGCRFCEIHCPDFAITIRERNSQQEEDSP